MQQPLLLLHGALGAAEQFNQLVINLSPYFDIHSFDFSGHGKDTYNGLLTMDVFADDIIRYLNENGLTKCNIFGYSMGGYAAARLAIRHPERISHIMTLGTKWHWDKDIAFKETKMLDANSIKDKVPSFATMLQHRHTGQGWESLLLRTKELMIHLGDIGGMKEADFNKIAIPFKVCLGSEDRMVTVEETTFAAKHFLNGNYELLEGLPHALEKIDMELLGEKIKNYFIPST